MAAYVRPATSPKAFTIARGRVFFVSANELWVLTTSLIGTGAGAGPVR